VEGELLAPQGGQDGDGHKAAGAPVQAGAGPHGPPGYFGDEPLKVGVELGLLRFCPGDVIRPEHFTADPSPDLEPRFHQGISVCVIAPRSAGEGCSAS